MEICSTSDGMEPLRATSCSAVKPLAGVVATMIHSSWPPLNGRVSVATCGSLNIVVIGRCGDDSCVAMITAAATMILLTAIILLLQP